jgi:hypothetical protein
MRLRLLALSLAALGSFALPAGATGVIHYDRECGGTVDVQCKEFSCRAVDCFWYDCNVYVDALHNGHYTTVCV